MQRTLRLSQRRFNDDCNYTAEVKSILMQDNRGSPKTQIWKKSESLKLFPYQTHGKLFDDFRQNKEYLKSKLKECRVINDYCRLCFKSRRYSPNDLQIFSKLHDLTKHVIERLQFVSCSFNCKKCLMSFANEINLNIHQHFSHEEGQYGIPFCGPII